MPVCLDPGEAVGGGPLTGGAASQDEAVEVVEAGDEGGIGYDPGKNRLQGAMEMRQQPDGLPGRSCLDAEQTLGPELGLGQHKHFPGKEKEGWPSFEGIGDIQDHDIQAPVRLSLQPAPGVCKEKPQPGVLPGSGAKFREKLPAEAHQLFIQVDHEEALDTGVTQDFPDGGTLPTAQNSYPLGMRVGEHDWVHQGFVVDDLVTLG
jgi:hypothetical protein